MRWQWTTKGRDHQVFHKTPSDRAYVDVVRWPLGKIERVDIRVDRLGESTILSSEPTMKAAKRIAERLLGVEAVRGESEET